MEVYSGTVIGVPTDMARIEFKEKCDDVGLYRLYRFAIGKTLSSHAKVESEHGVADDKRQKK